MTELPQKVDIRAPLYIFGVTLCIGLYGLMTTDAETLVPIHWNMNGEVDRYSSPLYAFLLLPVIQALCIFLIRNITRIDPKAENILASNTAVSSMIVAITMLMLGLQGFILMASKGQNPSIGLIYIMVGCMLIIVGNYLGKLKPSYTFGVRTPWTLASETVWRKTHRFSGKLFVAGGFCIIMLAFSTFTPPVIIGGTIGIVIAITLASTLYSWVLWNKENA